MRLSHACTCQLRSVTSFSRRAVSFSSFISLCVAVGRVSQSRGKLRQPKTDVELAFSMDLGDLSLVFPFIAFDSLEPKMKMFQKVALRHFRFSDEIST